MRLYHLPRKISPGFGKISKTAEVEQGKSHTVFKEVLSPKLVNFDEVMSHFNSLDTSKMYARNWALGVLKDANKKYKYWVLCRLPTQTIQKINLPTHEHDWGEQTEKLKWLIQFSDTPAEKAAQRYEAIKDGSGAKECIKKIENLKTAIKNKEDVGTLFLKDDDDCDSFRHLDCVHRAIAYSLLAQEGIEFNPPAVVIATNNLSRFKLLKQTRT